MVVHLRGGGCLKILVRKRFKCAQAGKVISMPRIYEGLKSSNRLSSPLSWWAGGLHHAGKEVFMSMRVLVHIGP